jgi:hypothetical protein
MQRLFGHILALSVLAVIFASPDNLDLRNRGKRSVAYVLHNQSIQFHIDDSLLVFLQNDSAVFQQKLAGFDHQICSCDLDTNGHKDIIIRYTQQEFRDAVYLIFLADSHNHLQLPAIKHNPWLWSDTIYSTRRILESRQVDSIRYRMYTDEETGATYDYDVIVALLHTPKHIVRSYIYPQLGNSWVCIPSYEEPFIMNCVSILKLSSKTGLLFQQSPRFTVRKFDMPSSEEEYLYPRFVDHWWMEPPGINVHEHQEMVYVPPAN